MVIGIECDFDFHVAHRQRLNMEPGTIGARHFRAVHIDMRMPFAGDVIFARTFRCEDEIRRFQVQVPTCDRVRDQVEVQRRRRLPGVKPQSFAMCMLMHRMVHGRCRHLRALSTGCEDEPKRPAKDEADQQKCQCTRHTAIKGVRRPKCKACWQFSVRNQNSAENPDVTQLRAYGARDVLIGALPRLSARDSPAYF